MKGLLSPIAVYGEAENRVRLISIDTRSLHQETDACFIALKGPFRDGMEFVGQAYNKGVRFFILHALPDKLFPDSTYLVVQDTLAALQIIARAHRQKFTLPIIAIAGRIGKTTVKEWFYELVKYNYHVVRSPKSYNSQIGVSLSLLEFNPKANLAIIEMGISLPGELTRLMDLVSPSHLFVTQGYQGELGVDIEAALLSTPNAFRGEEIIKYVGETKDEPWNTLMASIPFNDPPSVSCAQMAIFLAKLFGLNEEVLRQSVPKLPRLALRMESFVGKNNTQILNDSYHLDLETLEVSLQYMLSIGATRPRCVYIGLDESTLSLLPLIREKILAFSPEFLYINLPEKLPFHIPENAIILIKGTRKAEMEKFAARFRAKQHQTILEINLSALRHNLGTIKKYVHPNTKLLAMVKAQSYGTGLEEIGVFLQSQAIDYLGVAYTSEGVLLRKKGIHLPILVLNPDPASYEECIAYNLEPTVFTFHQLDQLVRELIFHGTLNFPIHVEMDTGMRRLGFEPDDVKTLIEQIKAQPEVRLKSVFSHFVESENTNENALNGKQLNDFRVIKRKFEVAFSHKIDFHMANSEAIFNLPEAHFDMVRIGLAMFGITHAATSETLQPVLTWKTVVSQIKTINPGESVSYGRSFIATNKTKIAIIPLGYADGFSRRLSNGKGGLKIQGEWCPTLGRVCMDMLMVDVSHLTGLQEGDEALVFDDVKSLEEVANQLETIPYEVMTAISDRVHRVYIYE